MKAQFVLSVYKILDSSQTLEEKISRIVGKFSIEFNEYFNSVYYVYRFNKNQETLIEVFKSGKDLKIEESLTDIKNIFSSYELPEEDREFDYIDHDDYAIIPLFVKNEKLGVAVVKKISDGAPKNLTVFFSYILSHLFSENFIRQNLIISKAILDKSNSIIVVLDEEYSVFYGNKKFLDFVKKDQDEVFGAEVYKFTNQEKPLIYNEVKKIISSGTYGETEVFYNHNDENIWYLVKVSPFDGFDNNLYYFIELEDITYSKMYELKLKSTKEKFQAIVQNINEYVYSVEYENGETISAYHSPKCLNITGYSFHEFMKNHYLWYDMIYKEDREKVHNFLMDLSSNSYSDKIEHRIVRKDGEIRWVSNIISVEKDSNGKIVRQDGYILDITDRMNALIELKKLYHAVEQSPSSVVITDLKGHIEYVNPKFTHLTGYSSEEVLGRKPSVLKSDKLKTDLYRDLWNTISSGGEWHGEFHNKKKSGDLYWEEAWISPVRNVEGEITNYIAVKEDITERKLAQEALRVSETRLRIRNEIYEKELNYAKTVAMTLLPAEPPAMKGLNVEFQVKPLEEVGGDFFDFYQDGENLGVFLGDVAGHGVAAALFLSLLKYSTQSIPEGVRDQPGDYIDYLNKNLVEIMPNYFITAFYCYFSLNENGTYRFSYASGGHPPMVHQKKGGGEVSFLSAKGTIVGMFESVKYETRFINLEKGDRIYLFTDGIPEAQNQDNGIIGFEGVKETIKKGWKENLKESIDAIISEVKSHCGTKEIEDDIVIIAIEVK